MKQKTYVFSTFIYVENVKTKYLANGLKSGV